MTDRSKIACLVFVGVASCGVEPAPPASATTSAALAAPGCPLQAPGSRIQHIIYVQFDNVHFRRDNPDVPSDLEQMPHLLDFITGRGTMLGNHHTPLISHTANDLITAMTGVYGDRHGQPVSNQFGVFLPPGFGVFDFFPRSFTYWTDVVNPTLDPAFSMITPDGKNAPAPWVAFTRAGCNVGGAAMANIELENVGADLVNVFGPASPEVAAARADAVQAAADLDGIAIHCAAGDPVCAAAHGGHADVLPDEPGGYAGFNALYGHKVVAPVVSPGGPLLDLDGQVITDGKGHVGFPGFDPSAAQTLAYVAAMQEHGVPVTFAMIGDAHDDPAAGRALGPGEAGYVARLAAYDRAWDAFFTRLTRDGITADNTLFVFTADENDHFVGGPASPAGCDGVHTPCTYAQIGQIDANVTSLVTKIDPTLPPASFNLRADLAPTFYVQGAPAPGAASARALERAVAQLTAVNPLTGATDHLSAALADPVEMKLLHMVTGDPQRTPTFVMFGNPDYFFFGQAPGQGPPLPDLAVDPRAAWNHGGIQPDITTTWLGLVGPGVRHRGVDNDTFTDHTDIRPTMLLLAGLADDYRHDGVAIVDDLHAGALPRRLRDDELAFRALARAYKQLTAPLGALGRATLSVSTAALAGDDATYASLEAKLTDLGARRDALAARMITALDDAEFHAGALHLREVGEMLADAARVLVEARRLARQN